MDRPNTTFIRPADISDEAETANNNVVNVINA